MTRDELATIVNTVYVAWNLDMVNPPRVYDAWMRYLSDLDFDTVMAVVDRAVTAGEKWAPRIGEVRRRAIDSLDPAGEVPAGEIAWQWAENRLRAVNSGVAPTAHPDPRVDQMIGAAMRAAGTGDAFHKQAFIGAWEQQVAGYEQERYGI